MEAYYETDAERNSKHQQKLVLELEDGQIYQAGMSLEQHKELLTEGCKIFLSNTKVLPKKRHTVCKIVQHGDWTGALNYKT